MYSLSKSRTKISFRTFPLAFILLTNVLDAFLTMHGLRNGLMEEANPIMAWLYAQGDLAFLLPKIALPVVLVLLLSRIRMSLMLTGLLYATSLVYAYVMVLHGVWIFHSLA